MKNANLISLIVVVVLTSFSQLISQPVPIDPEIRIGKLENGMTYYIRHNKEPKDRASFYIIQNVGSLLEEDNQNGLAHFLEHMAFNGTKHFPDKGIIKVLEKNGIAFGENINAYTNQNETVYNLNDAPIRNPGLIDTCLLILNDWSDYLLLTDKEIDAERGVITEEWRTYQNAGSRMREQYLPVLYNHSKHSKRNVIGDMDIVKNFKPETLRKFYKDWYRTDLQAIAVVGDIDVDEIERKIKALLGKIPAEPNPMERKNFDIPEHEETLFSKATDAEATNHSINIYIKHKAVENQNKDMKYYRELFVRQLFNRMINDRITELLQKGNPPFINGSIGYGSFARGYDMFSISASANPNKMDVALRAIYTEAQRLYLHGFTESELERCKKNILTQTESQWKQKDKISNNQYCSSIVQHYLNNNPLESMDQEWELTQKILPGISLSEVSGKIKEWMVPKNRVILVMGPSGENVKLLEEKDVFNILKEVESDKISPYTETALATSLISKELKGSKIIKTKKLMPFGAEEWTLANNAKVVFKKVDFQKDQVTISGTSPGGLSLYKPEILPSAMLMSTFVDQFGVGDFNAVSLKKMLAGKKASMKPSLGDLSEVLFGSATPKDFETMMQLLYLYFEQPRFEKDAFDALSKRFGSMLETMNKNPQKVMSDSLNEILTNYSKRTIKVDSSLMAKITLSDIEKVYRERFQDAGDFTFFIVGNIDENDAKSMVEKYIGSLTDKPRTETWINNHVGMPKGKTTKEIRIPLKSEKASVIISYNSKIKYSPATNIYMELISAILKLRFTEEIREKEGGTYGVNVNAQNSSLPEMEKSLQLNFDTEPSKTEHLRSIVYKEIEKLINNGPTADELDKSVKNMIKGREESKTNNSYWAGILTNYYRNKINFNDPKNFEDILKNVKISDIQKFAKSFFKKPDMVDVTFKPLK